MSIGKDFVSWLEAKGYGTFGTDIFLDYKPNSPNNCITVYNISAPVLSESSSLSVDQFGIQVAVRNILAETCQSITKDIFKKFIGFGGEPLTAGGETVSMTFVDTVPTSSGKDEKERAEWTCQFILRVQSENDEYRL